MQQEKNRLQDVCVWTLRSQCLTNNGETCRAVDTLNISTYSLLLALFNPRLLAGGEGENRKRDRYKEYSSFIWIATITESNDHIC